MDYAALAQKYGGTPASSGGPDLSSIAAKYGGKAVASAAPAPTATTPQSKPQSLGSSIVNGAKGLADLVVGPAEQFGAHLGQLAAKGTAAVASKTGLFGGQAEADKINSRLQAPSPTFTGSAPALQGTGAEQTLGTGLETAALAFPYSRVAEGIGAAAAPVLGKLAPLAGKVAAGAASGYGFDVGNNLANAKPVGESLQPGAATVVGGALPIIPKVIGAAARGAGESLGVSTGTGYGVIKEAFNAASAGGKQSQEFTDALRGKVAPEQIVDEAKSSLGQIVNNRSQGYQQLLKSIKGSSAKLDVSPVKTELDNQLEKFQIKAGPKGVLNFANSTIADKAEQSKVQNIYNDVSRWASGKGDNSPLGVDTLKRRIGGYFSPNSDVRSLVTGVKNSAKKVLSDTPGYTPAMKAYADASDTIEEIQKGLSLGNKASIDTSFRKLTSALRTNNEFRKELIGELDKASGGFLSSKIAGQQLNEVLPRGIARQIEGFGAGGLLLTGSGIVPLLQIAAVSSPRSVGEIVNALGLSKRVFNGLIDKLSANTAADATQTAGKAAVSALSPQPQPLQQQ